MTATNLSQTSMLAYVSISGWSATKLDRKASKDVTDQNGAVSNAARVNKSLLASADASLKEIRNIGVEARRYLDLNTLPWDDAGNRLLPNTKAMEVIAGMGELKKRYFEAVEKFVDEYPILRAQALSALGDLADASEYPPPDQIAARFSFRVSYSPLPTDFEGDVRYGLSTTEVEALQRAAEARVKEQTNKALMAAWQALLDDVAHMATKMQRNEAGEFPIFRNSTVENVRETAMRLKSLNVFQDKALDDMCTRVVMELCLFDPDAIRQSTAVRENVAEKATTIVSDLLGMFGE